MSYENDDGLHSVEVNAESLYEAIAEFREDKTMSELPGPATELTIGLAPWSVSWIGILV